MTGRRLRTMAGILTLALTLSSFVAWAYWTQSGTGSASAGTATLDAATIAVPGAAINSLTVTWSQQASLVPADAANSAITYAVERRLDGGSWAAIATGGCSGAKAYATSSCVDAPAAAGTYAYRVVASYTTWTATSATAGPVALTIDTTAPTVSAELTPAANGAGWNNTSPVEVALGADDAGGSGVAVLKYTTDGSDPAISGTAAVYSTALSIAATTTVRYLAIDAAGNASAVSTRIVSIDTTPPGAPALGFSALTNVSASGTTLFYRSSAAAGSFTVTASATDAGSGIASYALPTLPTGWSAVPGALGVATYSWIAANPTAPAGAQNVTATNNASLTSAATGMTLTPDNTAPTGAVTYADGYVTTASVSVSFSASDGGGAGVDSSSGLLQRAETALTDGTCVGPYSGFATVAGGVAPSSPFDDTGVAGGQCYQYRYLVSDSVGSQATIASAGVVKVDTTAPGAPALGFSALTSAYASGTTLFYRSNAAGGSLTVTASATDTQSGVASYAFPTLPAGWSAVDGGLGVRTYSWIAANPTAPAGAQSITATNNATLTSAATAMTLTADNAAPTGSVTYTDGYRSSASVSVTFGASDGSGSGVNASSGLLQRADATLTPSTGLCGTFSAFATVTGGTNPTSPLTDTSVINARCYRYRYLVSDNLAIQGTIAGAATVKVDTSAPAATSAPSVTSATAAWGASPACGVTGTRYVNAAGEAAVVIAATISAADAGDTVVFSATSAAPSPVTVTGTASPATGATTATKTLDLSAAAFGEGAISITTWRLDAAGNQSATAVPANAIVKDTIAPAAPAGAAYRDNVSVLGGKDEIYGTSAECGAQMIAVKTVGGSTTFNAPTLVTASGAYNFDVSAQALSPYSYNVTQTDRAQNKSAIVVVSGSAFL